MFSGLTVLVVDDEKDLREITQELLETEGAIVIQAVNGVDALNIVQTQRIDLVISDVRMPGGNGIDLVKNIAALKGEGKNTPPIVLLTGFTDVSEQDAIRMGASAVVGKPFAFDALIDTLRQALRST